MYVGVDEQYVTRIRQRSAGVAPNGRQAARNYVDVQPIAKAHDNVGRAIGGAGVSYQHFGIPHLRVILIQQRRQQTGNELRLVLGGDHDGQFARCIHGRALLLRQW